MRKPRKFQKTRGSVKLGSLTQAFNLTSGQKSKAPMPKEHHCKLVYKDAYNLAVNPGPKEIVFRLNSLYDPDYTSTGK